MGGWVNEWIVNEWMKVWMSRLNDNYYSTELILASSELLDLIKELNQILFTFFGNYKIRRWLDRSTDQGSDELQMNDWMMNWKWIAERMTDQLLM